MIMERGLVGPLGVLLTSVIVSLYLRHHIKGNFFIAKIVPTSTMSIYLIFCILIALSISHILFDIIQPIIIAVVIAAMLLAGVYWSIFLPDYRTWKELLTDWVGSNPEEEVKKLKRRINSLEEKINLNKNEQDPLSSIALKVDAIYCKQKLDSLEKSRSTARFMNIFVIACPVVSLILGILIWW